MLPFYTLSWFICLSASADFPEAASHGDGLKENAASWYPVGHTTWTSTSLSLVVCDKFRTSLTFDLYVSKEFKRFFFFLEFNINHLLFVCVRACARMCCVSACAMKCMWRTTLRAGSFLWSTFLWVSGIKLRSSGLHWKQFACLPISSGLCSSVSPCFSSNSNRKVLLLLSLRWQHYISLSVKADRLCCCVQRFPDADVLMLWHQPAAESGDVKRCGVLVLFQSLGLFPKVCRWWGLFLLSFNVLAMKWSSLHPIVLAENVLLHHELKISAVNQWNETS